MKIRNMMLVIASSLAVGALGEPGASGGNSDDFAIRAVGDGVTVSYLPDRTVIRIPATAEVTVIGTGSADVLLVGGGGGGGSDYSNANPGGGGGAGGFVYKQGLALTADTYSVAVGSGGEVSGSGGNTTAFGLTAYGGGRGADCLRWQSPGNGGSGGGGTRAWADDHYMIGAYGQANYAQQDNVGNDGGGAYGCYTAGGGGGAGAAGGVGGEPCADGKSGKSGNGGEGLPCSITGEEVWYAGGGAGGRGSASIEGVTGGKGGGGDPGVAGTDGLGGGGGGSAKGGSGIVIISYVRPKGVLSKDFDVSGGDELIKLVDGQVRVFRNSGTLSVTGSGTLEVFMVGGGGGGGAGFASAHCGGGGGAGGVLHFQSFPVTAGTYVVTVGAGGAPRCSGADSSIDGLGLPAAVGGGAGGSYFDKGGSGGSGGGAGAHANDGNYSYAQLGGAAAFGQGHAGGDSYTKKGAGGGGGAGASGSTAGVKDGTGDQISANGGDGIQCAITGTNVWYAGGGAGGGTTMTVGGKGGGGAQNDSGTDGLGGGGGGSGDNTPGAGGSGIVIVRYAKKSYPDVSPDRATGGTRKFRNGYYIHTFRSGGTFSVSHDLLVDVLLVGGGGGGGWNNGKSNPGGGGGAGGFLYRTNVLITAGSHAVVIGAGGATATDGDTAAASGGNTEAFGLVALGGGGGANCLTWKPASAGASGGGGTHNWKTYDWQLDYTALAGYGGVLESSCTQSGHVGGGSYTPVAGGGGGGAGAPGGVGAYPTDDGHNGLSGCGGDGLACSITGEEVWYAGGGAGGLGYNGIVGVQGGKGGGGNPNQAGTDGLGGGGGGGAKGGSGVFIVRYAAEPLGGVIIVK